ncbi:MAG: bifunctional ornithine acetyltransferase/N-acetylglutamate synthase, partial [Pseudomonadota bacterium]
MTAAVSPLAPAGFPEIEPIRGVRLATIEAGIRYKGRPDVMLAEIAPGASLAGVFTRSATRAAPVLWCERALAGLPAGPLDTGAAILVNAGNANAFTGAAGTAATERLAEAAAHRLAIPTERVFISSTGVIGEPLEDALIRERLDALATALAPGGFDAAAAAIRTTDTFSKGAETRVSLDGVSVRIAGIAKGSGMIAPDMATMLVYLFTDASVARPLLQDMLAAANARTFNCITVDSDTSTSDTVLLAATGAAEMAPLVQPDDPRSALFSE